MKQTMLLSFLMMVAFAISTYASSAEAPDYLRGLSIKSVWHLQLKLQNLSNNRYSTSIYHVDRNLYISLNGRIFEYQLMSTSPTQKPLVNVAEIDRAYKRPGVYRNELYTWTFLDGHLTLINQFVRGHRIFMYAIDRSALTCNLHARDVPDPTTHSVADYGVRDGLLYEVFDISFAGSTCTVSKGNIFAAEQ